jgi:beta-glucosidase
MNKLPFAAIIAAVSFGCALAAEVPPDAVYRDPAQPVDQRVADLIARLTLEEKARLLNHKGATVERFNIRADQWNQCLNGVKWDRPTTLFPVCIAMAATWDTDLVQNQIAKVLSDEARAIYNGWHLDPKAKGEHKGLIYRAPVINIERNPYWGRNHEAFGEDPFLTGRMAVAYVRGLQGDDPRYLKLGATLKHYAVNNVETDRLKLDAKVSERMLREYWLPHFRDAVVEGKAQSLMASYNAINGTPNNINRWLLTDLLKHEWKHEGFVVSDLGGVKTMVEGHERGKMTYVDAVAASLMAGCDFSDKEFEENIPAAVRAGKLTEERLNDALTRVLRARFRLGEFDPFASVPYSRISPEVIASAAHRAVALKAAQESIVLLQNRDGLLPLDEKKLRRIAVIGPLADRVVLNNYNGRHDSLVSALEGIKRHVGNGVEVVYELGTGVRGGSGVPRARIDREGAFSAGASVKLESTAAGQFIEFPVEVAEQGDYEINLDYKSFPDRGTFQLSIDGERLGNPVDMYQEEMRYGLSAKFGSRMLSGGKHLVRFTAVGKNPRSSGFSGHFDRLTITGGKAIEIQAETLKFATGREAGTQSSLEHAAELARGADVAVVVVGTDESVEQEGLDRASLSLPGEQEELVKQVVAANPRTVVIQMSAGPLVVPWLKANVPAMLQAWWAGGEGGHAIAGVLFGEVNPAGRLPHTVYASEAQVPPRDEYDITRGFTYMYVKGEPLFAFGHGLSYTTFNYDGLKFSADQLKADGNVTVTVNVTNTGKRAGDEVVQLYTHAIKSSVARPAKELRGFQRIHLQPGQTKPVTFALPAEKLAFWDEKTHRFLVELGAYEVMAGASSADIRLKGQIDVIP